VLANAPASTERDAGGGMFMIARPSRSHRRQVADAVGLHPALPASDHGPHWVELTRRLGASRGARELARELARWVVHALGVKAAAVYLRSPDGTGYQLTASAGRGQFPRVLERDVVEPAWTVTPIRWRETQLGVVLVEPSSPETGSFDEDLQLRAAAAQAAAALVADRHSRPRLRSPGIEGLDPATAAVIHDIKNAVLALSLLARNADGFADPEFRRDAVATLARTVDRMRRLLVALSSPAEDPCPSREPIDLEALIVEATAPLAVEGKVRLVRRLRPVPAVHGDRDALLRAVENLAINAAEAIDHEGTVTVTLSEEEGHAVISVADTGCGISEAYRARHLFAPFRSTKQAGWGLGLYQTKHAIERQSGDIAVESVEGRGTTFTVRLPLRADVEGAPLESAR
jgi:signal transduction histidine kinase